MNKISYILLTLTLIGGLISCSDRDRTGKEMFVHPYSNPLTDFSSADPSVLKVDDQLFYVYCTNTIIHKSEDLIHWADVGPMFSTKPSFVTESGAAVWAPDIEKIGDKYVLYYAMSAMGKPATAGIGIAYADTPEGPFKLDRSVDGKGKLFTSSEIDVRNSIDPCFFEENGQKWLFWGSFNGLYAVKLSNDGMRAFPDLATARTEKVQVAGNAFEAAYIHKRGDYYYLFASVGACCSAMLSTYTTVVGRSTSLLGPYVDKKGKKMLDNNYEVLIKANDRFVGPGHNSEIIQDSEGTEWILYHSYDRHTPDKGRYLMIDKIIWEDGWPKIANDSPSSEAESPVCE
ncbi:MAG: family 43 glycosylhydrolase [Bacteroides sp.]|jgi:arabinan endo-1,5-alpha-L-arabinosidase|nr:family 43 glycosylhydrolase [Bacteroides sp.]MCI1682312.1 family 43 glycosylhydrolase [Bacteroides sp.]